MTELPHEMREGIEVLRNADPAFGSVADTLLALADDPTVSPTVYDRVCDAVFCVLHAWAHKGASEAAFREKLGRAAFVAEHLMAMIDPQTWRDSGGDDGQGHYEGDYRAEKTAEEIAYWKEMAGGS